MKFTLGKRTIDIKVTRKGDSRASKMETLRFINELAGLYADRADFCRLMQEKHPERTYYEGEHGVIQQANNKFVEIFDQLDAIGFYDQH